MKSIDTTETQNFPRQLFRKNVNDNKNQSSRACSPLLSMTDCNRTWVRLAPDSNNYSAGSSKDLFQEFQWLVQVQLDKLYQMVYPDLWQPKIIFLISVAQIKTPKALFWDAKDLAIPFDRAFQVVLGTTIGTLRTCSWTNRSWRWYKRILRKFVCFSRVDGFHD